MGERGLDSARIRTETFQAPEWRRQVDWYSWGAVLFISDRAHNQHATVVAPGLADLSADFPNIPWYADLCAAAASQDPISRPESPADPPSVEIANERKSARRAGRGSCFGHFLDLPICMGAKGSVDPRSAAKCVLSDPCRKLRERCHKLSRTVVEVVGSEPERMDEILPLLHQGRKVIEKQKKPKARQEHFVPPEECREMAEDLWLRILEALELRQPDDVDNPVPGDCYLEEIRHGTNNNQTILMGYRELDSMRRWFIAFALHPKIGGMNVLLRLPQDHPALRPLSDHVFPPTGSRVGCRIMGVPLKVSADAILAAIVDAWGDLGVRISTATEGTNATEE